MNFFKSFGVEVTEAWRDGYHHIFPTDLPEDKTWNPKASCTKPVGTSSTPPKGSGIINCGDNMAKEMFETFFTHSDPFRPFKERDLEYTKYGDLHAFDQTPFTDGHAEAKMYDTGYIYIPHACKKGDFCKLVTLLHGCMESAAIYYETEARRLGILEYAATNNMIVLFPQNNDEDP